MVTALNDEIKADICTALGGTARDAGYGWVKAVSARAMGLTVAQAKYHGFHRLRPQPDGDADPCINYRSLDRVYGS